MRIIYKYILILTLALAGYIESYADDGSTVSSVLYTIDADEDLSDLIIINPKGSRIPAAPISCRISMTEGVQISGIDTSLIEVFEIQDVNGIPLAILADEESFIETIFSLQGEYRIIFRLNDRTLSGWVEI